MFPNMRRAKQALAEADCLEILDTATSGVLALSGDDGYPYAVPLSYVRAGRTLYFHCAKQGHKLNAVRRSDKASFCVVAQDDVVPEEFRTKYRSVIAFGRVRIIEDPAEMRAAIGQLADKYSPAGKEEEIERSWNALCMLAFSVEHMTGKVSREEVKKTRS